MEVGSVYPVHATSSTGTDAAIRPAPSEDRARNMHVLCFLTPDPLNHCARALDVVRRMGFDFLSVRAQPTPSASFLVHLNFIPNDEMSPSILADRVSGFIGVTGVAMSIV